MVLFCCFQHLVIKRYSEFLMEAPEDGGLKCVLTRLGSLFSLWRLNSHVGLLYQGTPKSRAQNHTYHVSFGHSLECGRGLDWCECCN